MSTISIIIPMYKVEKYIERCLDSVKKQSFQDWTAICIDDGSPDKSGKIAEEYAKKDKRIIVLHNKKALGPSEARNIGVAKSNSKYIMCLDGDDFIHNQTMEILYNLAETNKSDMVSFTYDRLYRPKMMLYHFLHLNTDKVVPYKVNKKYNLNKINIKNTDDVFAYATEQTHNTFDKNRKWLIKHCQVWKNMYRSDLIKDISFIKGILFEDFPWWSEVLLKQPRVTICREPLYYYRPNFGGIVLSAKQRTIMYGICTGIKYTYSLYAEKASSYQMKKWQENFLWFFIERAFSKIKYFSTKSEINKARKEFIDMQKVGVFNDVPNEWYNLREKIYGFINNKL